MEILGIVVAVAVITALVLRGGRESTRRAKAAVERTPWLTVLANSLGGTLIGHGEAGAWSPSLQRARHQPDLTLEFRRGPWHVRITEASCAQDALLDNGRMSFEHWIEVATIPLARKRVPLEFFTLYFEGGVARVECDGRVRPDDIVFLVDMILETLGLMPGVEPGEPSATL